MFLYLADPDPDWEGEVSAEQFQEKLMGRSTDEAVDDRNDGVANEEYETIAENARHTVDAVAAARDR